MEDGKEMKVIIEQKSLAESIRRLNEKEGIPKLHMEGAIMQIDGERTEINNREDLQKIPELRGDR